MMSALFWRAAGLSLACSAVLLPLLLASRFIRRRYSPRTCYVLWLLLALRLLLPFQVNLPGRTVTVEVPRYELTLPRLQTDGQTVPANPQAPAQTGTIVPGLSPVPTENTAASTVSLTKLLSWIWAAGMAVCGLWLALSYVLARRSLLRRAQPAGPEDKAMLDALVEELSCRRRPSLVRSDGVSTPMLTGLVSPVVFLPTGMMQEEELYLMLCHELNHLRRHDLAHKLFFQLVCVVHWFNPLVWWLSREAGRNLELCCDEDVVRGRDKAFRRAYGDILLKTAAGAGRAPVLSARMGGGKGYLKVRLNNLFIKKKNGAALVSVALAAAVLGGALVSCTGEAPEETQNEDWKAIVTSFQDGDWEEVAASSMDPAEVWKKIEMVGNVLVNCEIPVEDVNTEALASQLEAWLKEIKASQSETFAIRELVDSVAVNGNGVVTFTVPNYEVEGEWRVDIKGRMEVDGMGGMSIHYGFDPVDLTPGKKCSYSLAEQQDGITKLNLTDLHLSVSLGGQSIDIDLLNLSPSQDSSRSMPWPYQPWPYNVDEIYYQRDNGEEAVKGGLQDHFSICLHRDGTFTYMASIISSYLGKGTWTREGNTLCLADTGMQDQTSYYYFEIVDEGLVFQAENSAHFAYVDVPDGELFSMAPGPACPE